MILFGVNSIGVWRPRPFFLVKLAADDSFSALWHWKGLAIMRTTVLEKHAGFI